MSNARGRKIGWEKARHRPDVMETMRAGYQDRLNGLPYRPEYFSFKPGQQRNYESGRLIASEFLARASRPPAWPPTTKLPRMVQEMGKTVAMGLARMVEAVG